MSINEMKHCEENIDQEIWGTFKKVRMKRPGEKVLNFQKKNGLPVLTFPGIEVLDDVDHLFTTRLGGISQGHLESLNLGFHRGDDLSNVEENYRRLAKAMDLKLEDLVCTVQTHTTNIRTVTASDRGKGIVRPTDYTDVDGFITKEKGIGLVALFADCVPLYFVDPVKKAIGLAHSGWRGTAGRMGQCMVEAMKAEFGSDPKDLIAAIGPSICADCYEVDETVAEIFRKEFEQDSNWVDVILKKGNYFSEHKKHSILEPGKEPGKYQLDLWLTNLIILLKAGILPDHVEVTDFCTCHNADWLYSHRASQGKRGNLAACLKLK